jgi:hypothetical protein
MEIKKFQLKRVNPFQGLVIDADTWQDAHNYHRDQQRLHVLAFHDTGIVTGLEVSAVSPADYSVNINSGMAVDPDGNVVIVPQQQRYRLQTSNVKGAIYLIIQFREIPGEPFQPPEGGQPTRILEAYRIQERDFLPAEPYVELCRIDFDPSISSIRDAKNAAKPAVNEIDLRSRKNARQFAAAEPAISVIPAPPAAAPISREAAPRETVFIGHSVLGEAPKDLHLGGLKNMAREFGLRTGYTVAVEDQVNLSKSLNRFSLLYLTGSNRFDLPADQQSALKNYLQAGGTILGDGCSAAGSSEVKGAREFGLAFNRLAGRLECKLEIVKRGHPLLAADYLFSDVPSGCEQPILLEGGNMLCNSSDYGCAWSGGYEDRPLSRDIIRSAIEIGSNMLSYTLRNRSKK